MGQLRLRLVLLRNGDWGEEAQEEAKRRMERIQAALARLGFGDDMKDVWEKLNQEMSRAKKASEPQHLANDIEGKAAKPAG